MKRKKISSVLFASVSLLSTLSPASTSWAQVEVDSALPEYTSVSGVSGNLNSVGSDTLNNLMTFWAEGFKKVYPNINIQIEGKGSSTAPPALIEGVSQLGPMSRKMKSKETDAFEKHFGYKPTPVRVALDALAVFVHKDNPVKGMTLKQVDSIFSSTLKRGGQPIENWGQTGIRSGGWGENPVSLYGRNSASGTYGFFKKVALKKGDYKNTVKEQPGSSAVVNGIASDLSGIGYSGIGYLTSGVKAISLGNEDVEGELYEPTFENCLTGDYPLARFLYIYVNKKPGEPLDTLSKEFLTYVLSSEGQKIVVKDSCFPLPALIASQELKELE